MAEKRKSQESKIPAGKSPPPDVEEVGVQLAIDWHFGDEIITRFANQAMVQVGPKECHVSFFEVLPPALMGSPEEVQEQARALKSIRAECVARIVVTHEFLPTLIQSLQSVSEKLQRRRAAQDVAKVITDADDKKRALTHDRSA